MFAYNILLCVVLKYPSKKLEQIFLPQWIPMIRSCFVEFSCLQKTNQLQLVVVKLLHSTA